MTDHQPPPDRPSQRLLDALAVVEAIDAAGFMLVQEQPSQAMLEQVAQCHGVSATQVMAIWQTLLVLQKATWGEGVRDPALLLELLRQRQH